MTTHTMTRDTHTARIQLILKRRENSLGQFFRDVGVHVVARVIRRLTRINVETRSGAEIVRVCFAGDV